MDSANDLSSHPLNNRPQGSVMYRRFSDIDELAAFIPEDVRLTQLVCQPFACTSMALNFAIIRFNFNHVNCRLYAVGDKCPGFLTFTCLMHGQGEPVVSNHLCITEDYLWGFDPNRGADMVFPGHSTHCAVHIREDVFVACAQAMDRLDLNVKFLAPNHVYIPETLPSLRGYLHQLYELLQQQSPLLDNPDFQQLILRDFLPLLITALPVQREPLKVSVKAFRRSRLVKQANDYMQAHLDQPLTLTDLCQALGTSNRALCYGFQEIFGMSPMSYLKTLRLQSVYRALKTADSSNTTVTEIASQFGFYHLSYFARDYKQMFGELPSQTLKR
ncbi:helix-turn-helix domain-containing protein [Pantanalinema sp. GBBB05]|uniref:helix-turn-helix domain-containing protein n=1 Tax=Pantanalinema sp. GBBB05 TaxID=2604139 RepID=UPI003D8134C1